MSSNNNTIQPQPYYNDSESFLPASEKLQQYYLPNSHEFEDLVIDTVVWILIDVMINYQINLSEQIILVETKMQILFAFFLTSLIISQLRYDIINLCQL